MARLIPILFSTDMVQALLDGRKTMTRRLVKPQPESINNNVPIPLAEFEKKIDALKKKGLVNIKNGTGGLVFPKCPYGEPGDVLWVREGYCPGYFDDGSHGYKANWNTVAAEYVNEPKWKPSIHMPFEAARIFLRVKSVRVDNLQACTGEDAILEGVKVEPRLSKLPKQIQALAEFKKIWVNINGQGSWDANPWVWVIEFEKITKEDALSLTERVAQ